VQHEKSAGTMMMRRREGSPESEKIDRDFEIEINEYLNRVFEDLCLKDNGRKSQSIEAYYFLRVSIFNIL
jgi:hypothetical protein